MLRERVRLTTRFLAEVMDLKNVAILTSFLVSVACGTAPPPVTDITPASVSEKQRLDTVLDAYFEEQLELNPILASSIGDSRYNHVLTVGISESFRQKAKAVDEKYLTLISAIDSSKLDGQDRLSYQIFKRDLEESLEGYRYPSQLIPLNQFFSTP